MFFFNTTRLCLLAVALALAACSSDRSPVSENIAAAADLANKPAGSVPAPTISRKAGIWRGTDSAGHEYLLLSAPGGANARIADLTLGYSSSAFGRLNGSRDAASPVEGYAYWALSALAEIDSYGWSLCVLFAGWAAPLPIDGTLSCSQMPDGDWERDITLEFDNRYDLKSDVSWLAGTWTDTGNPGADVLNIEKSGRLTGQSAANDCIYAGQASIIDSEINLYSIDWSFDNCSGEDAGLNGVVFSGLATLTFEADDWFTLTPSALTFLGTGRAYIPPYEENGLGISLTAIYEKY